MASVDLTHVWIHDGSDLSSYLKLKARNVRANRVRDVERRRYAGGRTRAISSPLVEVTFSWEALLVNRAALDQLNDWVGDLLFYRDPWGRTGYGFIEKLPSRDFIAPAGKTNMTLSFEVITGDASV